MMRKGLIRTMIGAAAVISATSTAGLAGGHDQ
jgi:hypothetical protein